MRILLTSLILFTGQAFATISLVGSVSHNQTAGTCGSTSGTSCAVTLAQSTTGSTHLLIAEVNIGAGSATITALTDSASQTWTKCTACTAINGAANGVGVWYIIGTSSGVTSVTATISVTNDARGITVYEFSTDQSAFTFDVGGNRAVTTCTSCAGVALTLTGSNDVIVQIMYSSTGHTYTAIDTGYTEDFGNTGSAGQGAAHLLNTTTGTAPTWTASTTQPAAASAIAFNDGGGGGTTLNGHAVIY
jgi:hypothetical protein